MSHTCIDKVTTKRKSNSLISRRITRLLLSRETLLANPRDRDRLEYSWEIAKDTVVSKGCNFCPTSKKQKIESSLLFLCTKSMTYPTKMRAWVLKFLYVAFPVFGRVSIWQAQLRLTAKWPTKITSLSTNLNQLKSVTKRVPKLVIIWSEVLCGL